MPDQFAPDDEERVRQKAYALWQSEGEPHGRAEAHWTMAREMVATEDSLASTLLPVSATNDGEPAIALDNQGEFPGLADQGEESPHAPAQPVIADAAPVARPARAKPARASARR